MKYKLYNIIQGQDIVTLTEDKSEPVIDGMLYADDYIMVVAEEKMGKTILSQQIACNLTSGTPFLGVFDIPKPKNVWYFATEGRAEELKDRFIRMSTAVPLDVNRLKLITTSFRFNTKEGEQSLKELLDTFQNELPQVIIVDALYRAIKGSIKDDNNVNDFHHVVGWLSAQCNASTILVHHMTKPQRNQNDGSMFGRTVKDTFGSAFLLAAVDHCFWLERWMKDHKDFPDDKLLRCDTQRSGNISEKVRIRLMKPDPLYFTVVSKHSEEKHKIIQLLKSKHEQGMYVDEICQKSRISRSTVYIILKELQNEDMIEKYGTKRKYYKVI